MNVSKKGLPKLKNVTLFVVYGVGIDANEDFLEPLHVAGVVLLESVDTGSEQHVERAQDPFTTAADSEYK